MKTIMIAGLGNPGPEYDGTRHNVGFMAVDAIGHSLKARRFRHNRLADWTIIDADLCGLAEPQRILLVKPQTFMNNSGIALNAMMQDHAVNLRDVIIIHDEMDLPVGYLRVSFNATAAGHKGVRSIAEHCGGKGFVRIRIGIGKPDDADAVVDFVLSRFSKTEWNAVIDVIAKTPMAVRTVICDGVMAAQDIFNRKVSHS